MGKKGLALYNAYDYDKDLSDIAETRRLRARSTIRRARRA